MSRALSCIITLAALATHGSAGEPKTFTFTKDAAGKLPPGWKAAQTGEGKGSDWKVVADETAPSKTGYVMAQTAAGARSMFNLCVAEDTKVQDVEIAVAFNAVAGKVDQGGGIVWRYQDADNYYIARMNPLEDNYRLYKVVAGKRIQLATAENIEVPAATWHRLSIKHVGKKIECSLDGKKLLEAEDNAIAAAGKAGLWTKADAQTRFDQLNVRDLAKKQAAVPPEDTAEEASVAVVVKLRGTVERDKTKPTHPVIEANLLNMSVGNDDLAKLKGLTHLQTLYLGGVWNRFTDAGLAQLKELKSLKTLFLDYPKMTDAGLLQLKNIPSLEELSLSATPTTDLGLSNLKEVKKLRILNLLRTKITDAGLAHLKDMKNLEVLYLVDTAITDAGLCHLSQSKQLRRLYLDGTMISDAGVADLKGLGNLQELSLGCTEIGDEGLRHLRGLKQLRQLSLEWTQISDAGLVHLKEMTHLEELSLYSTKVGDKGLAHIEELREIRQLRLRSSSVGDSGLAYLHKMSRLEYLELPNLKIGDAGLAHLKDLQGIKYLDLAASQITDAGLDHLKNLKKLQWLDLSGNKIGNPGIAYLRNLKRLGFIDLRYTDVTQEGALELLKALPKTTVLFGK